MFSSDGVKPIFKARISTLEGSDRNGDPCEARVLPLVGEGVVTRPYPLIWSVRGGMVPLAVGDEVVCARFEDGTGIVLCRADGEWGGFIPGSVEVESRLKVGGEEEVGGQVTCQAGGTFSSDVTAAGVSVASHTHTCPDGETSGPH